MSTAHLSNVGGCSIVAHNFGWRHAGRKLPALTEVSFQIAPGEKVLILGESGAGKSTLLAALAGIVGGEEEGEAQGVVLIDGRDATQARGVVGMVLQDPDSQVIASRVGDDVAFGCENLGVPREEIWQRVPHALELVGLDLPLDHPTAELSGGQKQRLALAGVLAMGARAIVLDEPTANLDPHGVAEVRTAIDRVTKETGATLIVVEHRVDTWLGIVDRGIVLGSSGTVLDDAPIDELLKARGTELAAAGIWVPEWCVAPEQRLISRTLPVSNHEVALEAVELVSGWSSPLGVPRTVSFPAGASTVITGPNGAGKTTFALTAAGLLEPLGGLVRVPGISGAPHTWKSAELARRIGFVFQDPEHQFLATTALDELLLSARVAARAQVRSWPWSKPPEPNAADHERAMELLTRLRLDHLAAANPFSLSGGQKRRLSVATALMCSPQVVFLDEPTFGQDRRTFLDIVALLRELTEVGVAVAAITHDETYIELMGDHRIEVTR